MFVTVLQTWIRETRLITVVSSMLSEVDTEAVFALLLWFDRGIGSSCYDLGLTVKIAVHMNTL